MKQVCFLSIFLSAFIHLSLAQTRQTELCGFTLKQSRESIKEHFGEPIKKGTYSDGYQWETYVLNKIEKNAFITFEYSNEDLNKVWSVQVYGSNEKLHLGFQKIKLGSHEGTVLEVFGKPTAIIDIAKYGDRWEYGYTNYSFEIDNNTVMSIKIRDIHIKAQTTTRMR